MEKLIIIYILSTFVVLAVKAFVKKHNVSIANAPEKEWVFLIFTPVLNTYVAVCAIYETIKVILKHF